MLFSPYIRFQEVHAMLTRLLFQREPQRAIAVTKSQERQFVLLPIHLYRELRKMYQPYERQFPLAVRFIGITPFRKGMLSFERARALFEQGQSGREDTLVILRNNDPVGAMFLATRYEALLAFLAAKGVAGLEAFACDEGETDETDRALPIAAAVKCFTDLPVQFARELTSTGVSLPVLVSKNDRMVLAIFPWTLFQSVMWELAAVESASAPIEALIAWWRATGHATESERPVPPGALSQPIARHWVLCLKGDGIDLVEHFPYRSRDRVSVEARSVERENIPCAALLVNFLTSDGVLGDEQLAYLRTFLPGATVFAASDSLAALVPPSASVAREEG